MKISRNENSFLTFPDHHNRNNDRLFPLRREISRKYRKYIKKYILRCRPAARRRWEKDRITAWRKQPNMINKTKETQIKFGDTLMIKSDDERRGN